MTARGFIQLIGAFCLAAVLVAIFIACTIGGYSIAGMPGLVFCGFFPGGFIIYLAAIVAGDIADLFPV